jgi:hypothetical protein
MSSSDVAAKLVVKSRAKVMTTDRQAPFIISLIARFWLSWFCI